MPELPAYSGGTVRDSHPLPSSLALHGEHLRPPQTYHGRGTEVKMVSIVVLIAQKETPALPQSKIAVGGRFNNVARESYCAAGGAVNGACAPRWQV